MENDKLQRLALRERPETDNERLMTIYWLGGETLRHLRRGDFASVRKCIEEARKRGVQITDDALDGVIGKIAKRN
jgi:hypothetical protein